MSTLLVDGDIVAYQIAFRTEQPIRWDNELWTLHSDEKECKGLIDEYFSLLKPNANRIDVIGSFFFLSILKYKISFGSNSKSSQDPLPGIILQLNNNFPLACVFPLS